MIGYSYVRPKGGPRYDPTRRQAARVAAAAGDASTLTEDALAAMVSEDGIRIVCDVLFEVESNRLRRTTTSALTLNGVVVSPDAGSVASLHDGKRVASVATPAVRYTTAAGMRGVRQTWTDPRPINVVEVLEDTTVCRITTVRVWTLNAVGTATDRGTFTSAAGRISAAIADYDDPIVCYGVFVELILGNLLGGATKFALNEVDPMLVWDISDDVTAADVSFAAEDDPSASTNPYGTYAASSASVTLDDTEGVWSDPGNTSLDAGHRLEVSFGVVREDGLEELLPAGVFYTQPFDTDSDSTTVQISAQDRLGRNATAPLAEQVVVNGTVGTLVTRLAGTYLDLDVDQVVVSPAIASEVIPYAYPSGDLGSYLADVAKAYGAVLHMDPLERLVLAARTATTEDAVAVIAEDTALVRFTRPPGQDVTTSQVAVNAAPLTLGADDEAWGMPSGGITIPASSDYTLVATYSSPPVINAYVTGVVADGSYTIASASYFADRAEIKLHNNETRLLVVADLRLRGNPLVESTLTARAVHAPSAARYGPRELTVDAKLVQTQARLDSLAAYLLDAFRSLDDSGIRRRPDLTFGALGLLHLAVGDRLTLRHEGKGLGGDFVLISRTLAYAEGKLLTNDARVREAPGYDVLTYDVGEKYDDGHVYGF